MYGFKDPLSFIPCTVHFPFLILPKSWKVLMKESLTPGLFKSFQVSKVFKDHSRPVNSIDFDPSGNFLLTCSDDESMRIYTATTGK